MAEVEFEVRMEVFRITEVRDGAIYSTESQGVEWLDEKVVNSNKPLQSGVVYAAASGYWATKTNIRVKRQPK